MDFMITNNPAHYKKLDYYFLTQIILKESQLFLRILLSKLCVRIKGTFSFSLSKSRDNFSRTGPFLMYNSGNESYGHDASYAFGFIKIYLFFETLEPKTFLSCFS